MDAACALLSQLGGRPSLEQRDGGFTIHGECCPIAALAPEYPVACLAMEGAIGAVVGAEVRQRCDRTGRPRCRFDIHPHTSAR